MHRLLHQRGGLLHFLQTNVGRTGDVDQDTASALDRGLQQGAGNGHTGGLFRLALTGGAAHAHVGKTGILHNGGHVGEVKVNEARVANEVGDRLHCLTQHIVGDLESIGEGDLLIGGVLQTLVGDNDERVHLIPQCLNARLSGAHTANALKTERLGHHAHRQHALLTGNLCHDGSSACTGAAAHTGGDEHHVRILQRLADLGTALLSGLTAHVGVRACALTARQLLADLQLIACSRGVQRLLIRIHSDKINALHAAAHHAVHHIVAAAAHADDLNLYHVFHASFQSESHIASSQRDGILRGFILCRNTISCIILRFSP